MAQVEKTDTSAAVRGAEASLIESFEINGLYGYRSIGLSSRHAATILIAKNGSGKTTLLGALDAFLERQFSRLSSIEFSEIRCKLRGIGSTLVLRQSDVADFCDITPESSISVQARRFELSQLSLFRFIAELFPKLKEDYSNLQDNAVFTNIQRGLSYRYDHALALCDKLYVDLIAKNGRIAEIDGHLRGILSDTEIVYLPTYRRIELALSGSAGDESSSRRKKKPKIPIVDNSLFSGDIQFGLTDISERLAQLNQKILVESNHGYQKISADIINDLIERDPEDSVSDLNIPSKEDLTLFFSRIEQGRRVGPYYEVSVPNIDRVFNKTSLGGDSSRFLRYFLTKLSAVISATRDVELSVERFINDCNKYLSARDLSTSIAKLPSDPNVDGKRLCLDRRFLRVHVESTLGRQRIHLDALSSGEKQMVSLFAKLYLYPKKKLVLIDEPELSLSIDWQKQILVDVLSTSQCSQVIAITHSPFVFDNELEPFAGPLKVGVDREALANMALIDGGAAEIDD